MHDGPPPNLVLPRSDATCESCDICSDRTWTEPLELVQRAIRGIWRYQNFELSDFMVMCKVRRGPRPSLVLYKHSWTRRYLNVDAEGHTYRYFPPRDPSSQRSGQYRRHKDLITAMDNLDLWELPWMKPDLEEHRHGLSWQEHWVLRPYGTDPNRDPDPAATAAQYLAVGWCDAWNTEDDPQYD